MADTSTAFCVEAMWEHCLVAATALCLHMTAYQQATAFCQLPQRFFVDDSSAVAAAS
jgi:hypothetical protein